MSTSPPPPVHSPADDGAWRERLLASLRDCGVQPAPRNTALRWIVMFLVVGTILVLTVIVRQILDANTRTERDPILRSIPYILWYLFAVFVLARIRTYFLRQAWKSKAATAEDELARPDARRPILYLRSFGLDERVNRRTWTERFLGTYPTETGEQALSKALRPYGPTIAIGRPEEKLPALGAARFYVSHDRWKQKVSDVAAEAQFIV